jgi:hypothetical protein
MKTHVLRGSKQEIADRLVRLRGDVREIIVFEDEPTANAFQVQNAEDIFAEMQPFMVAANSIDDSREAIYSRTDGE